MTRENKRAGLIVVATFAAVIGGVMIVKQFRNPSETDTPTPIAKAPEKTVEEEQQSAPPIVENDPPPMGVMPPPPVNNNPRNLDVLPPVVIKTPGSELPPPPMTDNSRAVPPPLELPSGPVAELPPPKKSPAKLEPLPNDPDKDDTFPNPPIKRTRYDGPPPLPVPDPMKKDNVPLPDPMKKEPPPLPLELPKPETKRPELNPPPPPKEPDGVPGLKLPDPPKPEVKVKPMESDGVPGLKLPDPPKPEVKVKPMEPDGVPGLKLPDPPKSEPKSPPAPMKDLAPLPNDPPVVPNKKPMPPMETVPGLEPPPPLPMSKPKTDVPIEPIGGPKKDTLDPPSAKPTINLDPPKEPMKPFELPIDPMKPLDPVIDPMKPQPNVNPMPRNGVDPPMGNNVPEPRIESYDEEWYYCKQGDTLEAISQKFFFTPKYEQALRQYNLERNYAAVFRQEKPALVQGQVIKIPPARILERQYPSAIPGFRGAAAPVVNPTPSENPSAPAATFGSMGQDLGSPREFLVRRDGMTLKDIAIEELRDASQWQRIFLLNRSVNPSAPLPVGTRIYLPRSN